MTRVLACATLFALFLGAPAFATDAVVGFEPGTGPGERPAESVVVEAIGSAHRSVHVAIFQLTSRRIIQALMDARHRGVDVRAVIDVKYYNKNPRRSIDAAQKKHQIVQNLSAAGVGVRIDMAYRGVMHNKFIVLDGNGIETGSLNFNAGAARGHSANNVLWLRNSPDIAAQYENEWQRLWAESQAPSISGN